MPESDPRARHDVRVPRTDAPLVAWVLRQLAALGRGPVPPGAVEVRHTRSGAVLAFAGDVVAKVHERVADRSELVARLTLAADPGLGGVLLQPLSTEPLRVPAEARLTSTDVAGRLVSLWPRVDVVQPHPELVPWAACGRLLAELHRVPLSPGATVPVHGELVRLRRAVSRLEEPGFGGAGGAGPACQAVAGPQAVTPDEVAELRAVARMILPQVGSIDRSGQGPATLVHGDWHLGQVGRLPPQPDRTPGPPDRTPGPQQRHRQEAQWRLLDVDDLGVGDPVWDLARPAGFWAAGLISQAHWSALLDAYREAGGPAVPSRGDPWSRLDLVARAAVLQAAVTAIRMSTETGDPLDGAGRAVVDACRRMTR